MRVFDGHISHNVGFAMLNFIRSINKSRHEKTCFCHMRTTKTSCRSACGSAQSDQCLCYSLPIWYNASSFYIRNLKPLASFCGCTVWFESTLVANPEDRFSRDVAQVIFIYCEKVHAQRHEYNSLRLTSYS